MLRRLVASRPSATWLDVARLQTTSSSATNKTTTAKTATDKMADGKKATVAPPRPYSEVPGPLQLPLIKNAYVVLNPKDKDRMPQQHMRWIEKYGPLVRFSYFGLNQVIVSDPADVEKVFAADGPYPAIPIVTDIHTIYRTKFRPDLFKSCGVATNGKDWWDFRKSIQVDFLKQRSGYFYLNPMQETAGLFADRAWQIRNKSTDEMPNTSDQLCRLWSQEIRALQMLDVRFDNLTSAGVKDKEAEEFTHSQLHIHDTMNYLFFTRDIWSKGIPTRSYRTFNRLTTNLVKYSRKRVAEARERMKVKLAEGTLDDYNASIMERMFLRLGIESEDPVTMAVDALSAGVNTTSMQGAFLLYHLASQPEVQEKCYQEIMQVCGPSGKIKEKHITQLRYVNGVRKESARLLPAVMGTQRLLNKDVVLSGYTVPKGVIALLPHQIMGRIRFDRADEFLPERWIPGSPMYRQAHPYSWILFGHGKRMCLGRRLATLELIILVVEWLRRFKLEWHHPPMDTKTVLTNYPDRPLNIKLIPREGRRPDNN